MPVLFSDIDNTLIQSHRHIYHGKKVWVEYLNGHEQSYMPQNTYDYFRSQNWLKVIPVTTRTKKQYERLSDLSNLLGWDTALICNGAILLKNGKEDYSWTEESLHLSMKDRGSFVWLCQKAHKIVDSSQIIEIPDIMFYVKTEKVEEIYNYLFEIYIEKLIIFLEVLICRYSLFLQAFAAFFFTEDVLKSSYIPSCFRVQK